MSSKWSSCSQDCWPSSSKVGGNWEGSRISSTLPKNMVDWSFSSESNYFKRFLHCPCVSLHVSNLTDSTWILSSGIHPSTSFLVKARENGYLEIREVINDFISISRFLGAMWMSAYGCHQTTVQRYCSLSSYKKAI